MTDLIKPEQQDSTKRAATDEPALGRWYWVTSHPKDGPPTRKLMCVTTVGSNYVKLRGPADESKYDGHDVIVSIRIHFDDFWSRCEYVADPDPIVDGQIQRHQERSRELMGEVRRLTALLGVAPRQQLTEAGAGEVQALSVRTAEPTEQYKTALVKAKEETLPDLFEKLKASNSALGQWMKVKLIPMTAEAESLSGTIGLVEDRIFSVELYAGLVEEVELVRKGEPAPNDEPVHLMQRRHYMDEECLVGYETGGMDYKNIGDFERWLSKPKNFERIFPFPRTLVAFRVRRNKKEREVRLDNFIRVMNEENWDKTTFLYIRNGARLYRMETKVEFEEKLFPDTSHKLFTATKLWVKDLGGRIHIEDVISDAEYQGMIEDHEREKIELAAEKKELAKKYAKKDIWMHTSHARHSDPRGRYTEFTPASVYYDDISKAIAEERKKHNRITLIIQGLLDRSPVLQPHPPWQLWTNEGFTTGLRLHYDDSRALSAGDKPDFEVYRAKLNAYLATGSITIGQEYPWLVREAAKENEARGARAGLYGDFREVETFRPNGDPGPGKVARVDKYDEKHGTCTYVWTREKRNRNGWGIDGTETEARLVTGEENVLNVDAYQPGDFHIFFDDPRTRQEYLEWAPMLLEAEECHAGNREGFKPNRALPPMREPRQHAERPLDLAVPKPRPPRETLAEKWEGKLVVINRDMTTKGGTKFKAGEVLKVSGYHRRMLNLHDQKQPSRGIHGVELHTVALVGEAQDNK